VVETLGEADRGEQIRRAPACGFGRRAGDQGGHHDVLEGGEVRQEMMELEDEPDLAIPKVREVTVALAGQILAVEPHLASRRSIERAQMCSSVLFPTPDSPTIATRSPFSISRSRPESTRTTRGPSTYSLERLRRAINGAYS
jgi:hypothetical protein